MLVTKVTFTDTEPILEAVKEIAENLCLTDNITVLHGMLEGYMSLARSNDWREVATRLTSVITNFMIVIDKNTIVKED